MAKKPSMKGLFSRTETDQDPEQLRRSGKRKPIGLYLRNETHEAVEEIAQKEDIKIHALLAYAVTYFVRQYRSGKVKIEKVSKPKPNLDL